MEFTPTTRQTEPVPGHVHKTTKDVSVHKTPIIELGGGRDWEREGRERKRETVGERERRKGTQ